MSGDAFDWDEFLGTQITIPSLENILGPIDIPEKERFIIPKHEAELMKNYLAYNKLTQQHLDVYNQFLKKAANIICSKVIKLADGITIHFDKLAFAKPFYSVKNEQRDLTPMYARRHLLTYDSEWSVQLYIKKNDKIVYTSSNRIVIAKCPVMLYSDLCHLTGKNAAELIRLGEDPLEQGGYFIIVGVEKILMLEEKLSTNRIFIMLSPPKEKKYKTTMKLTTNTNKGTFLNEIIYNNNNVMKYSFQSLRKKEKKKTDKFEKTKKLNIIYVYQLFSIYYFGGKYCYKNEDIINLIKPYLIDKNSIKYLYVSLAESQIINAGKEKPITAIEIITKKIGVVNLTGQEKTDKIKSLLKNIFEHLEDIDPYIGENTKDYASRIIKTKIDLLSLMSARYCDYLAGIIPMDDRDDWANKRVEGPGRKMEQLMRNSWNKVTKDLIDHVLRENMKYEEIEKAFHSSHVRDTITKIFRDSFINSKWGLKGSNQKNNATQTLSRDNLLASLSHISTINVNIQRTDKNMNIRMVQISQYRYCCYVYTPEGENAGLVKKLAISTRLSLDRGLEGDRIIMTLIRQYLTKNKTLTHQHILMLNGKPEGWCQGEILRNLVLKFRRAGDLYYDTSLHLDRQFLYIDGSPSRLLSPVLIVDYDTQKLVIDLKNITDFTPQNLINEGAMEYISAWEEQNLKIAMDVDHLYNRHERLETLKENLRMARLKFEEYIENVGKNTSNEYLTLEDQVTLLTHLLKAYDNNKPFTHCEMSGRAALGVAADMIPFMQHNQAPRNIYQCLWKEELVLMADGSRKPIKDVKIGDEVITSDPVTFVNSTTKVVNHYVRKTDKKIYKIITKNGREIVATEDHKFMTTEGWREVREMTLDTLLLISTAIQSLNPQYIFIEIYSITEVENVEIADITVESENHSFIAGDGFFSSNCSMGTQAVGNYHLNYKSRFDGTVKVLESPTPPIVRTGMYESLGLSDRGMGQNINIAFMPMAGNEEDAFIFNQGSVDRGLFRMVKYFTYQGKVKISDPNIKSYFGLPDLKKNEDKSIYENLNEHGIPIIGSFIKEHQCVIGIVKERNGVKHNASIYLSYGERGIVDDVIFHETPSYEIIEVKLRITRLPKTGDKYAARMAQKGTIGRFVKESDMMFDEETGMIPDVIVNTTVIPSRMTISYLMELIVGKAAAYYGETVCASAFEEINIDKFKQMLQTVGVNPNGYSKMRDGETGRLIESEIYNGIVYFTALKHQPEDKISVRSVGAKSVTHQQPVKGRQKGGGLRFGEMESDTYLSHGSSAAIKERLCNVSDKYHMAVCKTCATPAVFNNIDQLFHCPICSESDAGQLTIPYVAKYQGQLLDAMGFKFRYVLNKSIKDIIMPTLEIDEEHSESSESSESSSENSDEEIEAVDEDALSGDFDEDL